MVDPNYDDGRGLYLDQLTVRTPVGFREEIRQAAQTERVPFAEYVRQALFDRMAPDPRSGEGRRPFHDGTFEPLFFDLMLRPHSPSARLHRETAADQATTGGPSVS